MSENTNINGWTITQGDYLRDPDYDDQFIKNKKKKVFNEKTALAVGSLLAFGTFAIVMGLMSGILR